MFHTGLSDREKQSNVHIAMVGNILHLAVLKGRSVPPTTVRIKQVRARHVATIHTISDKISVALLLYDNDFQERLDFCTLYLFIHYCILLYFLAPSGVIRRFTPEPYGHKCYPACNGNPDTCNPNPPTTDHPTPWPFVVSKMSDRNLLLNIHTRHERPFVVDPESKYAMLIR